MVKLAKSPSPILPDVSMSQSGLIVAALIGGFVIYLTITGKLAAYWSILTGGASATATSSTSSTSSTASAASSTATTGSTAATPTTSTPTTTTPTTTTTTPPAAITPNYANPSSYVGAIEAGFGGNA